VRFAEVCQCVPGWSIQLAKRTDVSALGAVSGVRRVPSRLRAPSALLEVPVWRIRNLVQDGIALQIAVCIKVVADSEAFGLGEEAIHEINPHDLPTLRLALELRAAKGGRVSAFSAADRACEPMLRRVLVSGVDEVHLIRPAAGRIFPRKDALRAIGNELATMKPMVVLCGYESADNMQGAFGAELAHQLGYAFISGVIGILGVEDRWIELERVIAPGWAQRIRCSAPVVLSTRAYSPSDATKLQLPLLPERIGEPITGQTWDVTYGWTEPDPWEDMVVRVGLTRVRERFVTEPAPSLPAAGRIAAIYASGNTREGTRLSGTPEEIAERLATILSQLQKTARV
jgi:electron transfer flavoprotein alpha/beta subunit